MILQLRCDGENCKKIGPPDQITTDYDGRDLCHRCRDIQTLRDLTQRREEIRVNYQRYANELKDVNQHISNIVNRLKKPDSGGEKNKT